MWRWAAELRRYTDAYSVMWRGAADVETVYKRVVWNFAAKISYVSSKIIMDMWEFLPTHFFINYVFFLDLQSKQQLEPHPTYHSLTCLEKYVVTFHDNGPAIAKYYGHVIMLQWIEHRIFAGIARSSPLSRQRIILQCESFCNASLQCESFNSKDPFWKFQLSAIKL